MTYQRKPHQSQIGALSKKSEHLANFIPPKVAFDIPDRITNSGAKGSYSQKADWANSAQRPGCMRAFSLPSLTVFKANSDRLIEAQEKRIAVSPAADVAVGHV